MVHVYGTRYMVYGILQFAYILIEVYGAEASLWPCRCKT